MNEWNPKLTTKTIKSLYLANKKVLTQENEFETQSTYNFESKDNFEIKWDSASPIANLMKAATI